MSIANFACFGKCIQHCFNINVVCVEGWHRPVAQPYSHQDVGFSSAKCEADREHLGPVLTQEVCMCIIYSLSLSDNTAATDFFRNNAAHQRQVFTALFCISDLQTIVKLAHLNVIIKVYSRKIIHRF